MLLWWMSVAANSNWMIRPGLAGTLEARTVGVLVIRASAPTAEVEAHCADM